MRIKDVADQAGVSVRSIRHYEAASLLTSTRLANGYRDFAPETVTRVRNIRDLLAVGLTLEDVAAFECCLDGDVSSAPPVQAKVDLAMARLRVLRERRDELIVTCTRLERALRQAQLHASTEH